MYLGLNITDSSGLHINRILSEILTAKLVMIHKTEKADFDF